MQGRKIISLTLSNFKYDETLHKIIELACARIPSYICFANAHMTVEAYYNHEFARMVNNATLVTADGASLIKAISYLHSAKQERVAGMDVMESIMPLCEKEGVKIFLFGSSQKNLTAIKTRINIEHPALEIAGTCSPRYGAFSEADNQNYINQIIQSGAQIILVSLGCPKQEKWMATYYKQIPGVLLGVGGAFPVYAGLRKRAPLWLRKLTLEWLFRLLQDPRRLFKRYLITNTLFIILLLRQWKNMRRDKKIHSYKSDGDKQKRLNGL